MAKLTSLQPLSFTDVTIDSAFWSPRVETNRKATLAYEYKMCKDTGRIDAFKLEWKKGQPNEPHIFWDSDVAKWVEAAAYSLATHPDKDVERMLEEVIGLIASAQQPDGYLNCHYTVVEPDKRLTNLRDCHELYCAGHLMEAAVAHYQATSRHNFLDVMCRYADYIDSVFGTEPGKKRGYCGHEEIELALVKLFHATGNQRYLKLSEYFVNERGRQPFYWDAEAIARGEDPEKFKNHKPDDYAGFQAHKPVREQDEAVGHAVRGMYLYSAMADLARELNDEGLRAACRRLWESATARKMYIIGGVGSTRQGEAFGKDYELPNFTAYAETCANIGLVFFAHRMLRMEADSQYADAMERALYNGVLSSVSLDGRRFFYANPLASIGDKKRSEWFGCACCPPNIARLLASMGQYIYGTTDSALYVHLYVAGTGQAAIGGSDVTIRQKTNYPWDGEIELTVDVAAPAKFDLMLRMPGWCRNHKLAVNGKPAAAPAVKGYLRLRRTWNSGDVVKLSLAMPVERMAANPAVAEDAGKTALQRGPVVYCLEQDDNAADVASVVLPDKAKLTARMDKKLLGGAVVIEGQALSPTASGWKGRLYRPADEAAMKPVKIKAIPYCLWNNRSQGKMTVWIPRV